MLAITTNIEAEQMVTILGFGDDPRGAWSALKAEHAGDSSQDIATITIELAQKKLHTGATIEEAKQHFSEMSLLAMRLRAADPDRALTDADLATKLLLSLPGEMEQIRYARLSGPSAGLTAKNVRVDVLALMKRMAISEPEAANSGSIAMHASAPDWRRQGGINNRRIKGDCWTCGRSGHRADECRSGGNPQNNRSNRGGRGAARGPQSRQSSDASSGSGGRAAITLVTVALANGGKLLAGPRDFVIDNAATCGHVSRHCSHFTDLVETDPHNRPTIRGIGDQRLDVHGRGTITLRLANGSHAELKNVSYVPSSQANIFAVRTALKQIAKAHPDEEHIETLRSTKLNGDDKTIITGHERGGLYYLDLAAIQDFA